MGIKITLDPKAAAQIDAALLRAAEQTIEALKTEVINAQVMPFNVGTMQNTNTFVDTWQNGDKIQST